MAVEDTTTPAPGVDSDAADISRMQNFLAQQEAPEESPPEEKPQAPEKVEATPESDPAPTDELTPADLPDDPPGDAPSAVDAFEIVHNGQQHKLSRADTIKYAQQGFDYTTKTQALAERTKQVDAILQRANEVEQLAPMVAEEMAQVKALETQLKAWDKVDFVALATNDPLEYPKYQAQFDQLRRAYGQARDQFNQKVQAVSERRQQITAQQMQQEMSRLQEIVPEFRDGTKFQKSAGEIRQYLTSLGVPVEAVDSLRDAVSVSVAYKAMQYDRLVRAKKDNVKQLRTAPPVTRPGSSAGADQVKADQSRDLAGRFKSSGEIKDAAALLLNRWKS